ncbi:MAG: hypothetical protein GX491_10665 [Chloroflexi bacterium]|nr:hypothetical protein [Chloroflexota bacterium]
MPKWEYLTLTAAYSGGDSLGIVKYYNDREIEDWKRRNWSVRDALSELGEQGWELVTVIWRRNESSMADPVYYFKREKPQ